MGQSRVTELQVFSGGLNLRIEPHLLEHTQARQLSNVDVRAFSLKSYREPEFVEYTTGSYMFYFNNQFFYYDKWRSNVEWNNIWYWSEQGNIGKTMPDGTEKPLGISPPSQRLVASEVTPTEGDGLTGDFTYVYTYYDAVTGAESPPSPPSNTLSVDSKAIELTGFDNSVGYDIRLYRIGGVFTAYTSVETISGQVTTYIDQKSYTEVEAYILDTTRSFPPPPGAHYLTEHQGRFYCALGTKVFFSASGKPDSWYLLDSISVEEDVTMLASSSNGLIICSSNKTWLLTGLDPTTFSKYLISDSEGCISAQSLATLDGSAIWLGHNGFLMSNGSSVQDISTTSLGVIKSIDPVGATIYNRMYMCSFGGTLTPSNSLVPGPEGGPDDDPDVGDLVPGSTEGNALLPEGAIIIDFSFGKPVFSTIAQTGLGDIGYYNGFLYQIATPDVEPANIVDEDGTANIITENGLFNIIAEVPSNSSSVNRMFEGADFAPLRYTSPLLSDGSIGLLKQYEKVRITYIGVMTVTIMNDVGEVMQQENLSSIKRESNWIGIPVNNNRGYGIRISIRGTGVVESIMYTWTPWEVQ